VTDQFKEKKSEGAKESGFFDCPREKDTKKGDALHWTKQEGGREGQASRLSAESDGGGFRAVCIFCENGEEIKWGVHSLVE